MIHAAVLQLSRAEALLVLNRQLRIIFLLLGCPPVAIASYGNPLCFITSGIGSEGVLLA